MRKDPSGSVEPIRPTGRNNERLPYEVAVWPPEPGPPRVVGQAVQMILARAIFTAARSEFAGRRVTISKGDRIVLDSEAAGQSPG